MLPPFWSRRNPMDLVAAGFGDVGLKVIELVTRCDTVDAILALNFVGVPNTGAGERKRTAAGAFAEFTPWEVSFLELVSALMEETGKPIINVADHAVEASEFVLGSCFVPVILSDPRAAAHALSKMAWYRAYKNGRA